MILILIFKKKYDLLKDSLSLLFKYLFKLTLILFILDFINCFFFHYFALVDINLPFSKFYWFIL